jgi:hypothetical protein
MKTEISLAELLRWRLDQAETEAPPAPRAARLLDSIRPWWERYPEEFRSAVKRLGDIQVAFGHAMAEPRKSSGGYPVPVLIVDGMQEMEASARILYFEARGGRVRLRFQLEGAKIPTEQSFEVTFVSHSTDKPLFVAMAVRSADNAYRIDASLSEELEMGWNDVKVTDRMPYRLILHPVTGAK